MQMRYFRNVNTSGAVHLYYYKADGTGNLAFDYNIHNGDLRMNGSLTSDAIKGTGIRAACIDTNGKIIASTNATSNYLTC